MKKIKASLNLRLKIPSKQPAPQKPFLLVDNRKTISRVTDSLYVSGSIIASDVDYLTRNNFTHVINCSSNVTFGPRNSNIQTLNLCLKDDSSCDIISHVLSTIKFIEASDNPKKKILFHCLEGISRGPAILAGYIMWKLNLSKDEAVIFIQCKRPCVDINFGFLVQLKSWEIFLSGSQNEDEISLFRIGENINSIDEKEIQFCDNLKDTIVVRLNKFFIFVGGASSNKNIVNAVESKNKEILNYLTNFYINYHKGKNVVNKIKTLAVNFKEFSQEKSFGEMIRKFVVACKK